MTLEEQLQLLRSAILHDDSDRVAGGNDFLWTDQTLVTYINEAQRRFAVKGLVLRDASTLEVTRIALVPGQSTYVVHESVLALLSVKLEDRDADLTRVGHSVLAAYRAPTDSWVDPQGYMSLPAGATLAYSTDEGLSDQDTNTFSQIVLRVYPVPNADQAGKFLRLRVLRKPLERLSLDHPTASPEIPEDHHIEMLDWAAYLALRIVDNDAGNPQRAEGFRATFEDHVTQARKTVMQKLFTPMGWSFGRGGFVWSN